MRPCLVTLDCVHDQRRGWPLPLVITVGTPPRTGLALTRRPRTTTVISPPAIDFACTPSLVREEKTAKSRVRRPGRPEAGEGELSVDPDPARRPPEGGGRHRDTQSHPRAQPVLLPWLRVLGRGILRYRPATWRDLVLGVFLVVAGASAFRGDTGAWERVGLIAIGALGLLWAVVSMRHHLDGPRRRGRR